MSTLPLFYVKPQVLQPRRHGARSLAGSADYRFTAHTNAVPLVAAELPTASRCFPGSCSRANFSRSPSVSVARSK